MSYKVTINNKVFELPKCTLTVEEKVEQMAEVNENIVKGKAKKRELVELMIDYVENLIGADEAKEVLDYTGIDDVDTKELEIAVNLINAAYSKKKDEFKLNEAKKSLADISTALNNKNISTMLNVMSATK